MKAISHERLNVLNRLFQNKVGFFCQKMGVKREDVTVKFNEKAGGSTLSETRYVDGPFPVLKRVHIIELPVWRILSYDDVPENLRSAVQNPLVFASNFNELLSYTGYWLNSVAINCGYRFTFKDIDVTEFLFTLKDRETFEKANDFILCHELGHVKEYPNRLKYKQLGEGQGSSSNSEKSSSRNSDNGRRIALIILVSSIWASVFLAGVCASFVFTLPLALLAIGITVFSVSKFSDESKVGYTTDDREKPSQPSPQETKMGKQALDQKEQEKICDLHAADAMDDSRGGILFFEAMCKRGQFFRIRGNTSSYDEQGNYLHDHDHPLYTDRIAYLQAWKRSPITLYDEQTWLTQCNAG